MKKILIICALSFVNLFYFINVDAQNKQPRFNALVLYENGGWHVAYTAVAKKWLDTLAIDSNFSITYIQNTDSINSKFLSRFQLFIQLDYAPYAWKDSAVKAFEDYIENGKGGWIGFHHAALLGEFDGYKMWDWFSKFMGDIRYENYISTFAAADVHVEDSSHPVMKNVPHTFHISKEEWYTWNKSPRLNVHVLATVDEDSYSPNSAIKMHGDHPVVWTNENMKARNVYIFMGHDPTLFSSEAYKQLFRNAIFWAAGKN